MGVTTSRAEAAPRTPHARATKAVRAMLFPGSEGRLMGLGACLCVEVGMSRSREDGGREGSVCGEVGPTPVTPERAGNLSDERKLSEIIHF